jgi:S-adenosyl-L-methionine hydrolase (adenosine-forming)
VGKNIDRFAGKPLAPLTTHLLAVRFPENMKRAIVTLLTDFGTADHYVAVMKGVLLGADAALSIVDLGHEIAPGDVAAAAFTLLAASPYFPAGTVHVVVVDPGVGTKRRVLAVEAAGQRFVGPDNGVFGYLLEREPGARMVSVTTDRYFRDPVSMTFHGRDIFAPLGAALAGRVSLEELGAEVTDAVRLPPLVQQRRADGILVGRILHVDRFGNCVTSFSRIDLDTDCPAIRLHGGGVEISANQATYAGAGDGEPFTIWGSSGFLELSVNGGSAAAALGLAAGDVVEARVEEIHRPQGRSAGGARQEAS